MTTTTKMRRFYFQIRSANVIECVWAHSLTDANFLGYGCVLLEDCCATTSPDFCTEATLWNVRKCFGFVADSMDVIEGLRAPR